MLFSATHFDNLYDLYVRVSHEKACWIKRDSNHAKKRDQNDVLAMHSDNLYDKFMYARGDEMKKHVT